MKSPLKSTLKRVSLSVCFLHGRPFAGRASNWQSNKLGCYITIYSLIARSVVLRRRNWTIIDLLGNVFIHNPARSRLSPQMAELCKERICITGLWVYRWMKTNNREQGYTVIPYRSIGSWRTAEWYMAYSQNVRNCQRVKFHPKGVNLISFGVDLGINLSRSDPYNIHPPYKEVKFTLLEYSALSLFIIKRVCNS